MTDIFLYSHHLHTWYCTDILRRNSVLVTHGSERVKPCISWYTYLEILREVFSPHSTVTGHFSLRCSTVRSVTGKEKYKKLSKEQLGSYSKSVRRTPNQPYHFYHFFQDLISSYSLTLYQGNALLLISIYILTTYWLDRVILLARRI